MIKRIKDLDPNIWLKVASVLLAMALWYITNYFSDPAIRMTVNNVSVDILHGEVIENQGDMYTVLDNTDEIPVVTLQAKRSVIDKLESKNIIATADCRDMEQDGSIRIVLTTDKYSGSVERMSGSISHVQLRVEPKATKSLPLEVETEGSPAGGYILYEAASEQNQVIVSGPQSYVNNVGRAVASVDISGAERSINSYPEIVLYDEDGNVISSEERETQKLHLNISSVKVVATIYQTKEVPVTCGSGVPIAYGYNLESEPAAEPGSVTVAGAAGILRDFEQVEIPAEDIASEPLTTNIHKSLKISKYLPEGIFLADSSADTVTVFVRIEEVDSGESSGTAETDTGVTAAEEETAEEGNS